MNPATCALEDLKTQGRAVIAFRRCIINRPENHEVRTLRFRLRNAFERLNGSDDARRLLGSLAEDLHRSLQEFRPE